MQRQTVLNSDTLCPEPGIEQITFSSVKILLSANLNTEFHQKNYHQLYKLVTAMQFDWLRDIKHVTIFHHKIMVSSLCMYYST